MLSLDALPWPRFASKEKLMSDGYVPCVIKGHGKEHRVIIEKSALEQAAFDDLGENSHVSHLFTGRLFNIRVRYSRVSHSVFDKDIDEQVLVESYSSHPVNRQLWFSTFKRYIPGVPSMVPIPVTPICILGSHANRMGANIEVLLPVVRCECRGSDVPPPFLLDCSSLSIDLRKGGKTFVSLQDVNDLISPHSDAVVDPAYGTNLESIPVVAAYKAQDVTERDLAPDFLDRNFLTKRGRAIHLTYSGFWPKQ